MFVYSFFGILLFSGFVGIIFRKNLFVGLSVGGGNCNNFLVNIDCICFVVWVIVVVEVMYFILYFL